MRFGGHCIPFDGAIKLKIKVEQTLLTILLCTLSISVFAASFKASGQPDPYLTAMPSIRAAYSELKTANDAGANVTALAARLNVALELLDEASNGDQRNYTDLTSQANSLLASIAIDAQNLRSVATAEQQASAAFRTVAIPLGALIVALVAVAIAAIRRKVQAKQFAELKVKLKDR